MDVAAAEALAVDEDERSRLRLDERVATRDALVVEDDVVVGASPDRDTRSADLEELADGGAAHDDETGFRALG
jgi:hypothetical protein